MALYDAGHSRGFSGGGVTAPRPSVTTLELLPSYGQSENRPSRSAEALAPLDAATANQMYFTYGLVDTDGAMLGPAGAALKAIKQDTPASGFMTAAALGSVSPAYVFQYARAARWRDGENAHHGAVIGDHGSGGRRIEEFQLDNPTPCGRNQIYWLRESARLAADFGVDLRCPYVFAFIGTSAKTQSAVDFHAAFNAAHAPVVAEVEALTGTAPKLVMVMNGSDVRSIGDVYATPSAQYRLALEHNALMATWQRIYPINDRNIHLDPQEKVLIGETCAWAAEVDEAGGKWNITYAVTKAGTTVTVTFDLRPGEVLLNRPDLYEAYGGNATCPHFGFEAEGGILSSIPDFGGNTVTLTLASATAVWLRFAHQMQDCMDMVDGRGYAMSAHRATLFGSETRPSRFVPDQTLWRPLPGFRGTFSGDIFTAEGN